jgi:hypothetical protein
MATGRYFFMNIQDRAPVDRHWQEVFITQNDTLSPGQQLRLHLRCLARERRFDRLGWHLRGIRRAFCLVLC